LSSREPTRIAPCRSPWIDREAYACIHGPQPLSRSGHCCTVCSCPLLYSYRALLGLDDAGAGWTLDSEASCRISSGRFTTTTTTTTTTTCTCDVM
ncbi:Os11g0542800, partial [Oryza sativa Japonica Group]